MPFPPRPLADRFWEKVQKTEGCWYWTASLRGNGYGQIYIGERPGQSAYIAPAHRVAYELLVGPIPEGLQIDHLCRNPRCVNPSHLEPVTSKENSLRGVSPSAFNSRKARCSRGHVFDGLNTYRYQNGKRGCRTCNAAHARRYRRSRRIDAEKTLENLGLAPEEISEVAE